MILEMVAWRDPNVVPIRAFYGDDLKVQRRVLMALMMRGAVLCVCSVAQAKEGAAGRGPPVVASTDSPNHLALASARNCVPVVACVAARHARGWLARACGAEVVGARQGCPISFQCCPPDPSFLPSCPPLLLLAAWASSSTQVNFAGKLATDPNPQVQRKGRG